MNAIAKVVGFVKNVMFVLAATILICGIICVIFRLQPIVITSESMIPTIEMKSVGVIDKKNKDASVGDIVAFERPQIGLVTHRVYKVEEVDGQRRIYTKGDAPGAEVDPWVLSDSEIVGHTLVKQIGGKTIFPIPYIGSIFPLISSKMGIFLIITFCICILVIDHFALAEADAGRKPKRRKKQY